MARNDSCWESWMDWGAAGYGGARRKQNRLFPKKLDFGEKITESAVGSCDLRDSLGISWDDFTINNLYHQGPIQTSTPLNQGHLPARGSFADDSSISPTKRGLSYDSFVGDPCERKLPQYNMPVLKRSLLYPEQTWRRHIPLHATYPYLVNSNVSSSDCAVVGPSNTSLCDEEGQGLAGWRRQKFLGDMNVAQTYGPNNASKLTPDDVCDEGYEGLEDWRGQEGLQYGYEDYPHYSQYPGYDPESGTIVLTAEDYLTPEQQFEDVDDCYQKQPLEMCYLGMEGSYAYGQTGWADPNQTSPLGPRRYKSANAAVSEFLGVYPLPSPTPSDVLVECEDSNDYLDVSWSDDAYQYHSGAQQAKGGFMAGLKNIFK